MGISPENRQPHRARFHRKENGHGFGLHISALAAGEMGRSKFSAAWVRVQSSASSYLRRKRVRRQG
jgi:hypothetical protein